jgi:protease IV
MPSASMSFADRRPGLFGLLLVIAAVILVVGIMAAFGIGGGSDGASGLFTSSHRFGLVHIDGAIVDAEDTVDFIHRLREDHSVKGVILRINSPGGAFGPSQELYMAIKRLAAVKPVVASFSAVAASGGYYAACPATKIIANPGTITGSIGVLTQFANVQDLLEKVGVHFESLTTGKLKDAGTPFKPLSPEQRTYLEGLIADLNKQFSGAVASERHLTPQAVAAIADGRAMTGIRAKELGLVDALGGQEEAIDLLKSLTHLTGDIPLTKGPQKKIPLLQRLTTSLGFEPQSLTSLARLAIGLGAAAVLQDH